MGRKEVSIVRPLRAYHHHMAIPLFVIVRSLFVLRFERNDVRATFGPTFRRRPGAVEYRVFVAS
jgi:hypothetical protein